jgi:hypothetical protein
MSSTNQAYPPRFKDLRSIAIRWWYQWRGIQIYTEMKILEQL